MLNLVMKYILICMFLTTRTVFLIVAHCSTFGSHRPELAIIARACYSAEGSFITQDKRFSARPRLSKIHALIHNSQLKKNWPNVLRLQHLQIGKISTDKLVRWCCPFITTPLFFSHAENGAKDCELKGLALDSAPIQVSKLYFYVTQVSLLAWLSSLWTVW